MAQLLVEYCEKIAPILHEEINLAIKRYLVELPKDLLWLRIDTFTVVVKTRPPLVGPLLRLRCFAAGGVDLFPDEKLILHRTNGVYAVSRFQQSKSAH